MNKDEVLDRLREELEIPFFQGKLEEKEYSEADYQPEDSSDSSSKSSSKGK